jgi:hypothetical protein
MVFKFCECGKPWHVLSWANVVVSVVFNDLRWDVVVIFVEIDGIVQYHYLIKTKISNKNVVIKLVHTTRT